MKADLIEKGGLHYIVKYSSIAFFTSALFNPANSFYSAPQHGGCTSMCDFQYSIRAEKLNNCL